MIRIFNEYSQFAHHPIPLLKNLPNQLRMVQLERESHNSFRNELLLFSFYCSDYTEHAIASLIELLLELEKHIRSEFKVVITLRPN